MTLRRVTRPVDGSIPVQALLYNDEELLSSQDGIGIYDGSQKSPSHQSGIVYTTTHRLFYIDHQNEVTCSFSLDLSHITQTEYYAGLFKSSAKVTLHLSNPSPININSAGTGGSGHPNDDDQMGFESWECQVCAYRNPPGMSPAAARICGLCGVPRTLMPAPIKIAALSSTHQATIPLSSSLPSSASVSVPALVTPRPTHARLPSSITCPACTFLNHPSMPSCEICGTDLPKIRMGGSTGPQMKSAPSSRPASPDTDSDDNDDGKTTRMMKLSFRKGGDKAFYALLKRTLQGKAWEIKYPIGPSLTPSNEPEINRSGISGILRTVEASAQGRDANMSDALQDLEALMTKAKDMVKLAADLNERLTATSTTSTAFGAETSSSSPVTTLIPSSTTEPEEATFIRSSLSQLGLQMTNAPVTLDMIKDERKWFEELAKELAGVLQGKGQGHASVNHKTTEGGMMKERGVIALDEVWGGWNRARGVALIPPSTFLQVLPMLTPYTSPSVTKRQFKSGLTVLHTPPYSSAAFAARICGLLTLVGPKTTTEIAEEEGMTIGLAGEMMGSVEETGDVCRDDGSAAIREGIEEAGEIERDVGAEGGMVVVGEVRWWANLFLGYTWDGQVDDRRHAVEE